MHDERGRGPAIAAAVLALSVSGHVLGGAHVPGPAALTLVAILALVAAALLSVAPRRPSVVTLALLFGAFQVVAHVAFHAVSGTGPVPVSAFGGHHAHPVGRALPPVDAVTHVHAHVPDAAHSVSPLMVTTHLLATVALAWLVGPATDQVRRVIHRVLLPLPRLHVPRLRPTVATTVLPWASRSPGSVVHLRGPPRFACV